MQAGQIDHFQCQTIGSLPSPDIAQLLSVPLPAVVESYIDPNIQASLQQGPIIHFFGLITQT